jgi:hypothetical protein
MNFKRKPHDAEFSMKALPPAVRGQATPPTLMQAWWRYAQRALSQMLLRAAKRRGFDDRRSRSFPVPCLTGTGSDASSGVNPRASTPAATLRLGASARVIPFPGKPRRQLP